ncbi:M23 family metallopeptidase [Sphingomonas sp. AR_OL41]|jgi:murein DD-endopeptidase MepM/ murein hydrolase activator NlpD|uniref:M23 family metallopeptidase n=1 Tax=Sphingomonas sp. AR_OL41 TaxID=3042729 RepID=UPI002480A8A5|nr:M23 family metallopeptidase [Sphingomonas sp. AR_OL41]MDH7974310.1 M23 family metallopeptidase [Sphingomonas sp. AR_OL41]
MRKMARWSFGVPAMIVLGSCTTPLAASQVQPAARPQRQPPPTATVVVPPRRAPDRTAFSYAGSMIQGGVVIGIAPSSTSLLSFNGMTIPVAPDGRFVIAFDRDAGPVASIVATLEDGRQVRDTLTVAPRQWDISRLNTLPKFPVPQPEFERLRPAELAQINAARRLVTDAAGWRQPFLWPTTGRISTLFGSQRIYKNGEAGSYHSGLDVAVPQGTPVLAPADGVVILAADHPFTLEGNLLMIDHGMGLNSAFLHLSRIAVHVGEHVQRGETIGFSGMTGRATGPHLHWSMKWREAKIDPLLVAGPMPRTE